MMTASPQKKLSGILLSGVLVAVWAQGAGAQGADKSSTWQPDHWFSANERTPSEPVDPFVSNASVRAEVPRDPDLPVGSDAESAEIEPEVPNKIAEAIRLTEELMARQQGTEEQNEEPAEQVVIVGPVNNGLVRVPELSFHVSADDLVVLEALPYASVTVEPAPPRQRFFYSGTEDLVLNLVVSELSWPGEIKPISEGVFDFQTAQQWLSLPWSTHRYTPPKGKYVDGYWIREAPKKSGNKSRKRSSGSSQTQSSPTRPQERPADLEVRVQGGFWDLFKPQYTTRVVTDGVHQQF